MPRIAPDSISRIAQRFVLQTIGVESNTAPVGNKRFAVIRDEMRHRPSHPDVSMQPETARHRMCHSFAAVLELTPADR